MLAGPSECLVIADEHADAQVSFDMRRTMGRLPINLCACECTFQMVAADLLAQAEHDTAARAILVTTSETFALAVDEEITKQLATLKTQATASLAIENNSFTVVVGSLEEAVDVSNKLAPEHLEVHVKDPSAITAQLHHYGALFIGGYAAEVLGDYGAGPNHTLPTGGTARSYGGLSVHTFLRIRTWLEIDDLEVCGGAY